MQSLTSTRPEIKVVADQIGTPTYAGDLAAAIAHIIESDQLDKCGIYHYSNEGVCSWYDFACEIARLSGNSGCEVKPCSTADYPTRAQRPQYSVLNKNKFTTTFGIVIPDWKDSLKKVIK
jgi:dTDP-4-dehydrorhamnose reductase